MPSGSSSSTTDYEKYGYDGNSNVVSDRRRDGNTLTMTYDALNRQTTKAGPGVSTIDSSYDLLGRKTAVTYGSPTGTGGAYTYDALNRVTSETTYGWRLGFQYDLAGDQTGVSWWDGFNLAYAYDTDGEMTSIQPSGANSTISVLASYAYDDLGRRTWVSRANGVPPPMAMTESHGSPAWRTRCRVAISRTRPIGWPIPPTARSTG